MAQNTRYLYRCFKKHISKFHWLVVFVQPTTAPDMNFINCILRQTRCYYGDEINKRESAGHVAHMQNMTAV